MTVVEMDALNVVIEYIPKIASSLERIAERMEVKDVQCDSRVRGNHGSDTDDSR